MSNTVTLNQVESVAQQTASLNLRGDDPAISTVTPVKTSSVAAPGPDYPYAAFLPSFDQNYKLAPLEPFEHIDPGHAALKDPRPRAFLDSAVEKHISPKFGSEIEGIQLSQLDDRAKRCANQAVMTLTMSQLALYVAQRGIVVFRDQDFVDQSPEWQLNAWGRWVKQLGSKTEVSTFGRLHVHPTSGQPKDYPEFHLVYRDGLRKDSFLSYYNDRLSSTGWHSDVTYEQQPPGLTTLFLYATPESGGDTAYVSQVGKSSLSVVSRTELKR